MSTPVIRGVIGYTITPFKADGALDLDALGLSIDRLIEDGVHAIAPLGSTGEGAYLSDSEWETVVRFSQARIAGRVPSVVSVSDLTTARTVQRARLAQACGATAVMVLPERETPSTSVILSSASRRGSPAPTSRQAIPAAA